MLSIIMHWGGEAKPYLHGGGVLYRANNGHYWLEYTAGIGNDSVNGDQIKPREVLVYQADLGVLDAKELEAVKSLDKVKKCKEDAYPRISTFRDIRKLWGV